MWLGCDLSFRTLAATMLAEGRAAAARSQAVWPRRHFEQEPCGENSSPNVVQAPPSVPQPRMTAVSPRGPRALDVGMVEQSNSAFEKHVPKSGFSMGQGFTKTATHMTALRWLECNWPPQDLWDEKTADCIVAKRLFGVKEAD